MADMPPQERLRTVVAGFRAFVEDVTDSCVDGFPVGEPISKRDAMATSGDTPAGLASAPSRAATLEEIRAELGDCRRCKLSKGRTQILFGVGNPEADLMFVGEGPGEEEDRQGEPFVGRAGQLLTDIITGGMGLRRGDVYIANVVKCRPPGNRNPEPDEITACDPFLAAQIDAVSPKVIVALGKFAAQTLLQTTTPISKLRGR